MTTLYLRQLARARAKDRRAFRRYVVAAAFISAAFFTLLGVLQ